jgi:prevent-host-death family protein
MATTVNMHEAKTRLSQLVATVEAGEEVVIARAGKPVAKLTAITPRKRAKFGFAKGSVKVRGDITDPLPQDLLDAFYNGPVFRVRPARHPKRAGASRVRTGASR